MKENSSKLPPGWKEAEIAELFCPLEDGRRLHQGWSPRCETYPSRSSNEWGVLKTTAIQAGLFLPEHNKLLPPTLSPRPLLEVKTGDLLITCAGPRVRCGVACLVRGTRRRLMISGKIYRFRTHPDLIDARYMEAYLQSAKAQSLIDRMKTGGNESGLNLTHDRFKRLIVPVAPLAQQKLIVAEIEKQFSRLDKAVANLKRIKANLKRYKTAVLKAAVEGKLTEDWRKAHPAVEPASKLLDRILTERRAKWNGKGKYKEPTAPDTDSLSPIPDGWTWTSIDNIIREPLRNGHSAKASGTGQGLRAFTLSAVTEGDFSEKNTKLTVAQAGKVSDLWAQPGDIYVERSNAPDLVGLARLYKGSAKFAFIPDLLIRVRTTTEVLAQFVEVCLLSEQVRRYFRSKAQGISGSMPKIDQSVIEKTPIPLPPGEEQGQIIAEVERRLSVIEAIEATVEANLTRAARLRQTILQQAFRGTLVE